MKDILKCEPERQDANSVERGVDCRMSLKEKVLKGENLEKRKSLNVKVLKGKILKRESPERRKFLK